MMVLIYTIIPYDCFSVALRPTGIVIWNPIVRAETMSYNAVKLFNFLNIY